MQKRKFTSDRFIEAIHDLDVLRDGPNKKQPETLLLAAVLCRALADIFPKKTKKKSYESELARRQALQWIIKGNEGRSKEFTFRYVTDFLFNDPGHVRKMIFEMIDGVRVPNECMYKIQASGTRRL